MYNRSRSQGSHVLLQWRRSGCLCPQFSSRVDSHCILGHSKIAIDMDPDHPCQLRTVELGNFPSTRSMASYGFSQRIWRMGLYPWQSPLSLPNCYSWHVWVPPAADGTWDGCYRWWVTSWFHPHGYASEGLLNLRISRYPRVAGTQNSRLFLAEPNMALFIERSLPDVEIRRNHARGGMNRYEHLMPRSAVIWCSLHKLCFRWIFIKVYSKPRPLLY